MKYLKKFEYWRDKIGNREDMTLSQKLAYQATINSQMDRLDNPKMKPKIYTGVLQHSPVDNIYYFQIPNTEKIPYGVKGVPPAPTLNVIIEPTEYFTEEDLSRYSALSSIMTYGWEDKSGKWKDYTYKFYGYQLDHDVHQALHITGIEKI